MVVCIFFLLFSVSQNLFGQDSFPFNGQKGLSGPMENRQLIATGDEEHKPSWSSPTHPKDLLLFADHLFKEGDYYRAITEYKRAMFYFPTYEKLDLIKYMIGKSYYMGGKYRSALDNLSGLTEYPNKNIRLDIKNLVGLSYLYRKDYIGAHRVFSEIIREYADVPNLDTYHILISMTLVNRKLFPQSKLSFEEFLKKFPKSKFDNLAQMGILESKLAIEFQPRRVWLATSLSVLLPGAGQMYNREWSNAFVAIVFNLALGYLAVRGFLNEDYVSGGIFASLFITFYAGNVYQAYRSAKIYNKNYYDERMEKINKLFERYKLSKD